MIYATVAAVDPNSIFTGAEGLLRIGPIGLAGLLLVLVVIVLLLRRVEPSQERILKLCLYVGAFCFIAALIAQYFDRPPPGPVPDFSRQKEMLANVVTTVDPSIVKLDEIGRMASDGGGCPGSGHGIAIPNGAAMASRSADVSANLRFAKNNIQSVINSLPSKN